MKTRFLTFYNTVKKRIEVIGEKEKWNVII